MAQPTVGVMITLGPYAFTNNDALRTMGNLGGLWAHMMAGRVSRAADKIGDDLAARLRTALGAPGDADLAALGALSSRLGDSSVLAEVLADVWGTLRDASEQLRSDGQMPAIATGRVTQLSRSGGGVPKLPVDSVDVDFGGVVGDKHTYRVHHGRPWQALCLWCDEVIDAFRADGHPLHRGAAGENITVSGLNWADVRPGVLVRIGDVLAHVQAYAEPCKSNAQWFLAGNFALMGNDRGSVSRVYATVLEPGRITTADRITLEPPPR